MRSRPARRCASRMRKARYNFLLNTLHLKSATGRLSDADMERLNLTLGRENTLSIGK
jgi:hypothetical protein